MTVGLAHDAQTRAQAFALRYRVFVAECGAAPPDADHARQRERDRFDARCDHIVVRRQTGHAPGPVVATARVLIGDRARETGFCAQSAFDLGALTRRRDPLRLCELGRICVAPEARHARTLDMVWAGLWAYVQSHKIDVLFGTASLAGTDDAALAPVLGHLQARAPAPSGWRVPARPGADTVRSPGGAAGAVHAHDLPPLLRAYLAFGGHIGPDAVRDTDFGTTDVLVTVPIATLPTRYARRFARLATRSLCA